MINEVHSLVHIKGEIYVLFFGEEQNEEVIASLTLLDGRIEANLWEEKKIRRKQKDLNTNKKCG